MSQLDKFKNVVRATRGVASTDAAAGAALDRIREILDEPESTEPAETPEAGERLDLEGENRLDLGGQDRSEG